MRAALAFAIIVASACSSNEPQPPEGGVAFEAGTCCPRGTPTYESCGSPSGPVAVGGYGFSGGCKQMSIPACHGVHSGSDDHGCPIWIDDGSCDCNVGKCQPILDITGFSPSSMKPPHPRMPGACTTTQISDFAACNTGETSACESADASTCAACLSSGPLVDGYAWNIGGCVDLVLGQTSMEPSSCGSAYDAFEQCIAYACGGCPLLAAERASCEADATKAQCSGYAQPTTAPNGPCAPLLDAGAPDIGVCFPDLTITDPVARQRDFITRLATFFCGP